MERVQEFEKGKMESEIEDGVAPFTVGEVLTVPDTMEINLHDNNNDDGKGVDNINAGLQISNNQQRSGCCRCDAQYGTKVITIILFIYGIWNVFMCSSKYFIRIHSISTLIVGILSIIGGIIGAVATLEETKRFRKIALKIFYYFFLLHCVYHVYFFIETVIAHDNCPCGEPLIDLHDSIEDDTDECLVGFCQFLLSCSAGFTFVAALVDVWFVFITRKICKQF